MEMDARYLTYEEVYEMCQDRRILGDELPVEAIVSLPLPTLRWNQPLFASFASTISGTTQKALTQSEPSMWWLIDAHEGQLVLFTSYRFYPFASQVHWETVTIRLLPTETLEDVRSSLVGYMDHLASPFFANQPGSLNMRKDLLKHLEVYIHPLLLPQYRALAPDFFAWLEQHE